MKDKLSGAMKKFSGAIVQPIMFMAVTGYYTICWCNFTYGQYASIIKGYGGFLIQLDDEWWY